MTHLTIPSGTPRLSYTANGSTGTFPITFPFFSTSDVVVYVDEVLQASGYTVTGTAVDGGYQDGNVVFTANPTAGAVVVVTRSIAIARSSDFPYPSGTLPIGDLNTEFDRVYALLQDLSRAVGRAIRLPEPEDGATALLPARATRVNGYSGFDANGDPTIKASVDLSGTTVSGFMNALLGSANSAAALATLNTGRVLWCAGVVGGRTIALTPATPITALVPGMVIAWIAPSGNTSPGAVTVNISGLGAVLYLRGDGTAFGLNALAAGLQIAVYDGTSFYKIGPDRFLSGANASIGSALTIYDTGGALNPNIDFGTNGVLAYTKSTTRLAWTVGGALAPLNVGAGALIDDTAAMSQGWHILQSTTVSGSPTSVAFVLSTYLTRGFKSFRLYFRNLAPAVAAVLYARMSVDAGATWKSAGGDYGNGWRRDNTVGGANGGSAIGYMQLSGTTNVQAPAGSAPGISGWMEWDDFAAATIARYETRWISATPQLEQLRGTSNTAFTGPVNAVQIAFVGGGAWANQGSVHLLGLGA